MALNKFQYGSLGEIPEEKYGRTAGDDVRVIAAELKNMLHEQTIATHQVSEKLDSNFKLLIEALTGKDQMPVKVVSIVVKTMGLVIFGCIIVIIFLLTGIKVGFLPSLH